MSRAKKTNIKFKITAVGLLFLVVAALVIWYFRSVNIPVLEPKGIIAKQERQLIFDALLLALLVVIPVFTLLIVFAVRYRETNSKAKYSPNLDGNRIAETIWWLIPTAIISILAVIAWNSSHTLDPYKPLSSNSKPLTIQVVALDWKWLFIYPQQNIATVNFIQFPKQTPLNFEITSDTVMNSFWIPQLGGQIYAMPGMSTQLHLMASGVGSYNGLSANISGAGFAGMDFTARSSSQTDFSQWVQSVKHNSSNLSLSTYSKLTNPSQNNPASYYSSAAGGLYNNIIDKYMIPAGGSSEPANSPTGMQGYMQ